jgi:hypothetical protein
LLVAAVGAAAADFPVAVMVAASAVVAAMVAAATSAVVAVVLEAETLTVAGVFPTSRFQVPDHRWEDVIRSRRLLPRDLRVSAEGERMISHQDLPTGWTQGLTTAPDLTVTVPPPLTAIVPSPLTAIVPSRQTDFRDAI